MQVSSVHSGAPPTRTSLENDILRVFTSKLNARAFLSFSTQVKQYAVLARQNDVYTRMRYLLSTITHKTKTLYTFARGHELQVVWTYIYPNRDSTEYACIGDTIRNITNYRNGSYYGPCYSWGVNRCTCAIVLDDVSYYSGDISYHSCFDCNSKITVKYKHVEIAKFYFDGDEQSYQNALRRMQWCWNDLLAHGQECDGTRCDGKD